MLRDITEMVRDAQFIFQQILIHVLLFTAFNEIYSAHASMSEQSIFLTAVNSNIHVQYLSTWKTL